MQYEGWGLKVSTEGLLHIEQRVERMVEQGYIVVFKGVLK